MIYAFSAPLPSPPGRVRWRIPALVPSLSPCLAHALRARSHHAQAEELERFFRNLASQGSGYIREEAWCAAVMRVSVRARACVRVGPAVTNLQLMISEHTLLFPALTLSSLSTSVATVGGSKCWALIACSA